MNTTVVQVQNLVMAFDDFKAVNDISFSVKKGEIFGFLGANGAGKTTTIRILCGLLIPTSGDAFILGQDIKKSAENIKGRVGYMSQKFTLYDDLTVEENLAFTGSLRRLNNKKIIERTQELFDFIQFKGRPQGLVRDLPGGIKQQMALVSSLLHDPELIFLDEPTAGVSPVVREAFWKLIRKLAEQGKTIFVTTHYMDEAEQCDRIVLMRAGKIIALDTPAELKVKTQSTNLEEVFIRLVEGKEGA